MILLGPGKITTGFRTGSMVRYRFASFELIEKPGGIGYLARLADAGPERVEFLVTPCVVDEGCGFQDDGFEGTPTFSYGQVQWILPLEGGEYLVFYTTVLDAHGKQAIYMAHERPRFGPITGAVPPPGATGDLPAGAQPMNELERACAVYAGCGLFDPTLDFKSCLKQWITEDTTRPGLVAARARFIAAATSCPALSAVAASSCRLECTLSGGTCGPVVGNRNACACAVKPLTWHRAEQVGRCCDLPGKLSGTGVAGADSTYMMEGCAAKVKIPNNDTDN